jgi:hypothetical protein
MDSTNLAKFSALGQRLLYCCYLFPSVSECKVFVAAAPDKQP